MMDHALLGLTFLFFYLLTVNSKNQRAIKRIKDVNDIHIGMIDQMKGDINELRTIIYKLQYHGKENETKKTDQKDSDTGRQ